MNFGKELNFNHMNQKKMKLILEGYGVDPSIIDEVARQLTQQINQETRQTRQAQDNAKVVALLKQQIKNTKDWRKKAALNAQLYNLSNSLE